MDTDYLASVRSYYNEQVLPHLGHPVGSREVDIAKLELDLGFQLPLAYRQYLLWMGDDRRGIFVGCDWFLSNVRTNTEYLPELLAENNVRWQLPDHYVVFMSHQGYMAAYFSLPTSDPNPPVFFYSECNDHNSVTEEGSFTDFLFRDLSGMASCLKP